MQTQPENPNVWIDENRKPHYLHDGFWYGPNVVQSDDGPEPSFYETTDGKIIKTENSQYLYEYNHVWYGQDKIFRFDNGFWEEKKRGDDYYTVSYKDIGTISTLIDTHLIDILTKYDTEIKELSKDYNKVISSLKRMIIIYTDIKFGSLFRKNKEVLSEVVEFLLNYTNLRTIQQVQQKYRNTLLSNLIKIITNKNYHDPNINEYKIFFKSRVEPKLQDMLYTRIIFFYFQNDNQHDINQQINRYIEIFDRQESRDLIRKQCQKIIPYLEYALSHATELNEIQINESELPETGSDILAHFTEEGDFPLSECLQKADCYIYISSNTGKFFEGITADQITAMIYPEDLLIKAMLSFRTWLFRCTGPPQKNPPRYDSDGLPLDPTITDGVPNELKLSDDDGNLLIDPVAYAILTINANSQCLVTLSNILSVLYYRNHIMYVVMKPDIDMERSVSWNVLYNYNYENTTVSGKHCQYGSNQKICELQISQDKIMREAEDIGEDRRQTRLFRHLESYLEDNRKRYILEREKYELKMAEEEALELQKVIDEIEENEQKDLSRLVMQDIREESSRKAREQQLVREENQRANDRANGTVAIEELGTGGPIRHARTTRNVPRRYF